MKDDIPVEVIETEKSRSAADLKVGSVVWHEIERYYRSEQHNPEDLFSPLVIIGETRVSWVAKFGWREFKFSKKKGTGEYHKDPDTRIGKCRNHVSRIFITWRAVVDEIWGMKNRDSLRKHLDELLFLINRGDINELRRIAKATGYQEIP